MTANCGFALVFLLLVAATDVTVQSCRPNWSVVGGGEMNSSA